MPYSCIGQAGELERVEQEIIVSLQGLGFSLVNNLIRKELAYASITRLVWHTLCTSHGAKMHGWRPAGWELHVLLSSPVLVLSGRRRRRNASRLSKSRTVPSWSRHMAIMSMNWQWAANLHRAFSWSPRWKLTLGWSPWWCTSPRNVSSRGGLRMGSGCSTGRHRISSSCMLNYTGCRYCTCWRWLKSSYGESVLLSSSVPSLIVTVIVWYALRFPVWQPVAWCNFPDSSGSYPTTQISGSRKWWVAFFVWCTLAGHYWDGYLAVQADSCSVASWTDNWSSSYQTHVVLNLVHVCGFSVPKPFTEVSVMIRKRDYSKVMQIKWVQASSELDCHLNVQSPMLHQLILMHAPTSS